MTEPHVQHQSDFRIILQEELLRRIKRNPSYSIRAFARALNYDQSMLSKLLNGKAPISVKTVDHLGKSLGLVPEMITYIKRKLNDDLNGLPRATYAQISVDQFHLISEWYHFAILELIKIEHFKPTKQAIAKSLGISTHEAAAGVERLERLGLLTKDSMGMWHDTSHGFSDGIIPGYTDQARRALQKSLLELSISAIGEVAVDKRDNNSLTMAIDSENIPLAKKLIRRFLEDMSEVMSQGKKDSVYNLSVALCPLTKNTAKEKK